MSRWMLGVTACLGLTGLAACASPSQPIYTPGVAAIPDPYCREAAANATGAAYTASVTGLPADQRRAMRAGTIELLAAALQEPVRAPQTTAATRTVAEAYIDRHLRQQRLSAAEVSRAVGVSIRSLHRAFEDSGESVASFIRLRRLSRARDDLLTGMTVGQVARRWHYTDPSHFSRSFKRHFGISPSDLTPTLAER